MSAPDDASEPASWSPTRRSGSSGLIVVHGGVSGNAPDSEPDLGAAVAAGSAARSALDAVERAVMALEDHPQLNSGFGAVLDRDGHVRLDAGIMDGPSGAAGGVTGVTVKHPVRLARRIMTSTPHVLMCGDGAMELGRDMEVLEIPASHQTARWEKMQAGGGFDPAWFGTDGFVDTVGAVAIDDRGNLAAAASTGGLFGKRPGRAGDSCVPGAGFFANASGAAVATGLGEMFLETSGCFRTVLDIEHGLHPQEACERTLQMLNKRYGAPAALLAIDADARVGAAYGGGSWPLLSSSGTVSPVLIR